MAPASRKPRARPERGAKSDGFLLVEALTTMAISAFLLVALASTVSLLLRASDRSTRVGQTLEDTNRVMASLAREIERIAPYRWAGRGAGFVFAGTPQSLMFGVADSRGGTADAARLVLLESAGARLIRAEAPLSPLDIGSDALANAEPREFYGGPLTVRFAYYALLEDGQEALTDSWNQSDELPIAIHVSLIGPGDAVRAALRVPILVDAEPGCAAPGKAVCRYIKVDEEGEAVDETREETVDPDDPLGWMRYAK